MQLAPCRSRLALSSALKLRTSIFWIFIWVGFGPLLMVAGGLLFF